jgi:hypothetical protein
MCSDLGRGEPVCRAVPWLRECQAFRLEAAGSQGNGLSNEHSQPTAPIRKSGAAGTSGTGATYWRTCAGSTVPDMKSSMSATSVRRRLNMAEAAREIPRHLVPASLPDEVSQAVAELDLGRAIAYARGGGRPKRRQLALYAFDDGLVFTDRRDRVVAAPYWEDVHSLLFDVHVLVSPQLDIGSVLHQFGRFLTFDIDESPALSLEVWDAPDRTLASDYAVYGMREDLRHEFAPFVSAVRDKVAAAQLPHLWRRIAEGAVARFGPFTVSRDGLRCDGELVPWAAKPLLFYGYKWNDMPPKGNRGLVTVRCGPADGGPFDHGPELMRAWSAQVPNLRTLERLCDGMQADPSLMAGDL